MAYQTMVKKVFRQHNSLVVTLPVLLIERLNIQKGDHVVFSIGGNRDSAKFYRFSEGSIQDGRDKGGPGRKDIGRRKRVKDGGKR